VVKNYDSAGDEKTIDSFKYSFSTNKNDIPSDLHKEITVHFVAEEDQTINQPSSTVVNDTNNDIIYDKDVYSRNDPINTIGTSNFDIGDVKLDDDYLNNS
jgi:hypothetical protein